MQAFIAAFALLLVAAASVPSFAELPLIPRAQLFGHGDKMRVRLSSDGKSYAFVSPIQNGSSAQKNLGIYIAPVHQPNRARLIYEETTGRMPMYSWTLVPGKMVVMRDVDGSENEQLHLLDISTGAIRNVTADPTVKTHLLGQELSQPDLLLYETNSRSKDFFDIHVLNLRSGETRMLYENKEGFLGFLWDDRLQPRIGMRYGESGNMLYFYRQADTWELLFDIPFEEVTGFDVAGANFRAGLLYLVDARDRDKGVLKSFDLQSKRETILAASDRADVSGLIVDSVTKKPLAAQVHHTKITEIVIDPFFQPELDAIKNLVPGAQFEIMSQSADGKTWLIAFFSDDKSVRYIRWNRVHWTSQLAYVMQPEMDALPLAKMNPVVIQSRDGLELVSYLTIPKDVKFDPKTLKPEKPLPMVLDVHGGPWARDSWGYNPVHQWLSNRGYAVLSVNYRGSTGFGKNFVQASFGEWGGKMHDDLVDAVQWAINQGVAIKDKVAIMGGSYGGYAALVGLTFTPDLFVAGVDIVGVANLVTMQQSTPSYWKPFKTNSDRRMGADVETEEGREFFKSRSPLTFADRIRRPLLIGHGDNDPRVKVAEAEQITAKMQELRLPVTFVRFPDEGHGFARPANNQSFNAIVEIFLQRHLGGRAEPLKLVPGTSIQVPVGCEEILGLKQAMGEVGQRPPSLY